MIFPKLTTYTLQNPFKHSDYFMRVMLMMSSILLASGCELAIRAAALPLDALSDSIEKSSQEKAEQNRIQERNDLLHMHGMDSQPHRHVNSGEGEHKLTYSCLANDESGKSVAYPSNIDCGNAHMHGPTKAPHRHNTSDIKHGRGFSCLWNSTKIYSSDIFCSDHTHEHMHWVTNPEYEEYLAPAHKHLHEHTGKHEHKFMCHSLNKGSGPSNIPCDHDHEHMHSLDTDYHKHKHSHEGEHKHADDNNYKNACLSTLFHRYRPSNVNCNGSHTHMHIHTIGTEPHSHPHKFEGEHKHLKRCKYNNRHYSSMESCP